MTYINHYPTLWKYISIFPSESETNLIINNSPEFKEALEKVLKTANLKKAIRDKEMWAADHQDEELMEKVVSKQTPIEKVDNFFMLDEEMDSDINDDNS